MSYYVPNNLLSKGGDAKTIKGEKKGWKTYIMYMSPFTDNSKGVNLCPHATAGCAAACLNGSGRGGFTSSVQVGRRKPVIQGGPAGEILHGSPGAGSGRDEPSSAAA